MKELSAKEQVNIQKWLEIIHQCRGSGLSNQQWCEQNGVSLKSYYYWIAKIRKMAIENLPRKQTALSAPTEVQKEPVFAPISDISHQSRKTAPVTIRVGNAAIEIATDTPEAMIQSVILAVSKC